MNIRGVWILMAVSMPALRLVDIDLMNKSRQSGYPE
jgi:hypothetical protein